MTPLGLLVGGFLLVVLDLRADGFDFLPDLVGWSIASLGLWQVRSRSDWFGVAVGACVIGVLLAVPGQVGEPQGLLLAAGAVVETLLVFSVCSGVAATLVPDEDVRETALVIRWLDLALVVVATGAALLVPQPALVLLLGLATFAVAVWFLAFVWSVRGRPQLQGPVVAPA